MLSRRQFLKAGCELAGVPIFGSAGYKYVRTSGKNAESSELPQGSFFSVPPAEFDPVMGFRWLSDRIRWVGIVNSEVVFDNTFSGNNYGYICSYNYTPKKPSPEIFRFAVLGDSFTAGLELTTPWPERLQQLLCSRAEKCRVEVYSFAIDGGGLLNWHSVLTKQILPKFELDALIIASWYENLKREFVVYHSDESYMYIKHFAPSQWPTSQKAFEKVRPSMKKLFKVMGERELDRLVSRVRREGKAGSVTVNDYCQDWTQESEPAPSGYVFSTDAFIKRYGAERLGLVGDIVEAAKKRGIPIIFCAVPTRQGLLRMRKEDVKLIHRVESEGLCRHFGLAYFDGYEIFDCVDAESIIDLYWLKYDGHWAQAAANLFALRLAEWVTLNGIVTCAKMLHHKE